MPTYFLSAPMRLHIGATIDPGNFGRLMRTMYPAPNTQNPVATYREALFEYARLALSPDKVSRLSCLFVCPTLDGASSFRTAQQPANIVYEVEPTGDTTGMHIADIDLINFPKAGQFYDGVFTAARKYWLGLEIQNPEVLLPCPVRVVGTPEGLRNPTFG